MACRLRGAGEEIGIAATKLSVGVTETTRDFASTKRGKFQFLKHKCSDTLFSAYDRRAAGTARCTRYQHAWTIESSDNALHQGCGRNGGSLMALKSPHIEKIDKVKSPN